MSELIKQNLAHAYQIIAMLGMDDHTYTHLSARSENANEYYIYPFGLRFEEVTVDNLLKVDFDGNIIEGEELQYNKTGYIIHGNIYKERQDLNSIFHLHTPATVAVSSMESGLLYISQWALHFYNKIAYYKYDSLALNFTKHGKDLLASLADKNILLMQNHGMLTCGKTIWEAMFYTYHLEMACKTQCLALQSKIDLITPEKEICEQAVSDLLNFEKDIGIRDWHAWVRKIKNR